MTLKLENGNCLELMKNLPDKSIDLFICDLPYTDIKGKGETNCKWNQSAIDLNEFWKQFKRLRKSKKVACIHFCSTKFGYTLIKSNEKLFKMDMVWVKRNKTGGLQSRHRPMRNHEMVYFFYEQAPKYFRDKYHKRIVNTPSVLEPISSQENFGWSEKLEKNKETDGKKRFDPPNPVSVIEEKDERINEKGKSAHGWDIKHMDKPRVAHFEPKLPLSVIEEEDEPGTIFKSKKVFIGKRHHQTEKPLDILEFFLKYWSDEGDTILDPTMGSGSVGVACKNLKRNFIGFELDEKIFKIAQERIKGDF